MPAEAAASAAATPPPAVKPAPITTPSGKAPQGFDVRLALAKTLGTPRGGDPPAEAPAAETEASADADGASDADGADGEGDPSADASSADDGDETADGEGEASADAATGTPEERLEAAAKAFEAGDIEAMGKALARAGVKVTGPVKRAFRAHARRLRQVEAKESKLSERERNFEESRTRAQQQIAADSRRVSEAERVLTQKYGGAYSIQQAFDDGDALALGKALERACKGASLASITQLLASGKQGKSPEERALAERERKLAEETAAKAKKEQTAEEQKIQAQRREAALGRVGEALKTHPYLQTTDKAGQKVIDTEALNEVFTAYEASWNGEKFTKTARQCADELQEKLVARATARGLAPASAPAPAAAPGKTAPATAGKPGKKPVPSRPGLKEPPRTLQLPRGTPQELEATRAARVAQARRITEMQRRGVR